MSKPGKIGPKLQLRKETLRILASNVLDQVHGGFLSTNCTPVCSEPCATPGYPGWPKMDAGYDGNGGDDWGGDNWGDNIWGGDGGFDWGGGWDI